MEKNIGRGGMESRRREKVKTVKEVKAKHVASKTTLSFPEGVSPILEKMQTAK